MSTFFNRDCIGQTLAIATFTVVLATSIFIVRPAPGETVRDEVVGRVLPHVDGRVAGSPPVSNMKDVGSFRADDTIDQINDQTFIFGSGDKTENPTDDPLAIFNTPALER